jgi:hypothetical protein
LQPANATRSVEHDDVLITAVNDPFIEPHYAVSDPSYPKLSSTIATAVFCVLEMRTISGSVQS